MKLTPEVISALESALGGGVTPDHPDADQDYDQICEVIEQKLTPAFEMIGQELAKLRAENDNLKDIVYRMVTSFSDAATTHKRGALQSTISGKYGPDLESLKPIYSDFSGRDIEQDLIDALMESEGNPEELAGQMLGGVKERFGKYLGGAPAPGKEPEVEKPIEEMAEPEKAPIEGGKVSVTTIGNSDDLESGIDPVSEMLKKVQALRGRTRKTA